MITAILRASTLVLGAVLALGGCQPPQPTPSVGKLLPGVWRLAGKPGTTMTLTGTTETSGPFVMTHDGLIPATFRGRWMLRGRILTVQIDEFPPAATWVVPLTGQTPTSKFVQDIVRIDRTVLILRGQGQPVEERYERVR